MQLTRFAIAIFALLLCLFGVSDLAAHGQTHSGGHLVLLAKKSADPKRTVPKSDLYTAELSNAGSSLEVLEAVQMPGGYVGSGEFFACGLDRWSVKQKKWIPLRPAKLSSFGQNPNLKSVQIKPGESIQVCEMMLPSQAGSLGDCVRFRLQMQWRNSDSAALFSTPFLIDARPGIQIASCGPELLPDSFPGSEGVTSVPTTDALVHDSGHVDPPKQE
jgi:hypothetical protein